MNNANDSADEEQRWANPVSDYRALLEMTRALAIARETPSSPQVPGHDNEAMPPETGLSDAEAALKRGEIVYPERSGQRVTNDEEPTDETASPEPGSNLRIRIYLGMS
jgi:hypothetical protein